MTMHRRLFFMTLAAGSAGPIQANAQALLDEKHAGSRLGLRGRRHSHGQQEVPQVRRRSKLRQLRAVPGQGDRQGRRLPVVRGQAGGRCRLVQRLGQRGGLTPRRGERKRACIDARWRPVAVLYDGACPLCRREIALYRGLRSERDVRFVDVSGASALPPTKTHEQLLARFHVRRADGTLISGAKAFLTLWAHLPGWHWLARAGRTPGVAWSMERGYRLFLRWRPALQRVARRVDNTGASACSPRVCWPIFALITLAKPVLWQSIAASFS